MSRKMSADQCLLFDRLLFRWHQFAALVVGVGNVAALLPLLLPQKDPEMFCCTNRWQQQFVYMNITSIQ